MRKKRRDIMENTNEEFNTLLTSEQDLNVDNNESKLNEEETIMNYTIVINLPKPTTQIEFEILATGQIEKIAASNNELRLMQGRFYFIPVEPFGVNSDDFKNIKVLSDMARIIEVKYVKDGFACVSVLRHNVTLKHGTRICVIW